MSVPNNSANKMSNKDTFNQPPTETFSIYDVGVLPVKPDTSTPLKKAVIEYEDSIRNQPIEHGAFFDSTGLLITSTLGDASSLSFSNDDLLKSLGSYFTHNHPQGGTFSKRDIETAISMNLREIRAVTRNFRYSMQFNEVIIDNKKLQKAIDDSVLKANDIVSDMIKTDKLNPVYANDELNHQIWVLVARELKLKYTREKS